MIKDIGWPGPKPYRFAKNAKAARTLAGRRQELGELRTAAQSASVVEITAPSGVGKTSFVNAAAPFLQRAGAEVRRALPWSDALERLGGANDAAALYAIALEQQPVAEDQLPRLLERLAGDRVLVCIFDQLEELLRYRRDIGRRLLELIGRTAPATRTPHIVIARSEFRDELRPVEVAGTPMWHIFLKEISDPEVIAQIVAEPAADADVEMETSAVNTIVEWWKSARATGGEAGYLDNPFDIRSSDYGLLHLQALLWNLKRWLESSPTVDQSAIKLKDILAYAASRDLTATTGGATVLENAMYAYVAETVAAFDGKDWPNGPRLMTARIAQHLSSAGYKVPQAASSLAPLALHEELPSSSAARDLARRLREAKDASARTAATTGLGLEGAGIAASWDADDVAASMVSNLLVGLDHLASEKTSNILRKFRRGEDAIYELVHDGVGVALNRWAENLLDDPVAVIGVIAARSGQPMRHDLSAELFHGTPAQLRRTWGAVKREKGRAVIVDARWIGNSIGRLRFPEAEPTDRKSLADLGGLVLENIVFDHCVFRGSVFIGVSMKNVTFRNCILQGVAMLRCALDGVRIEGEMEETALDTLTIHDVWPGAQVDFAKIAAVQGLFLTSLRGGLWTLHNVNVDHLVMKSVGDEPFSLDVQGKSTIRHATLDAKPTSRVAVGKDVVISPRTDDNNLLGRRALPDG